MLAPIAYDVRDHVIAFVSGEVDAAALSQWVVEAMDAVDAADDPDTVQLFYRIYNRVSEHTGGHLSEDDLRGALRDDVAFHRVRVNYGAPSHDILIHAGSAVTTVAPLPLWSWAGTPLGVGLA